MRTQFAEFMPTSKFFIITTLFGVAVASSCELPWAGEWIENGFTINITRSNFGKLGACRESKGEEFLLVTKTERFTCTRCLLVFPVHDSVLQYKNTGCIPNPKVSLKNCFSHFTGDSVLHTIFKKDAPSIPCPLQVPLKFTYHDNRGTCSSRTSHIERCAQWNRLSIQYQACPENPSREASISELECIATWNSMGQTFVGARIGSKRGENFRCFIIQSAGTSGLLGLSADASCQELAHIGAAASTLHYKQAPNIEVECEFPSYMWKHEGKRHKNDWISLVTSSHHRIHRGNWISSYGGRNDSVWKCLDRWDRGHIHLYRTHVRKGCSVGYQCVQFQRRKKQLISITFGPITSNEFDDCSDFYMNSHDSLILEDYKEPCPIQGRHFSSACSSETLSINCENNKIRLLRDCSTEDYEPFTCAAHYGLDDGRYIVIRNDDTGKLQCVVHFSWPKATFKIFDHIACDPKAVEESFPSLAVNVSNTDRCDTNLLASFLYSSSSSQINFSTLFLNLFILYFLS